MSTTTYCGRFISDGKNKILTFNEDINLIKVKNLTKIAAPQTDTVAVEWEWQTGFQDGTAFSYGKSDAAGVVVLDRNYGFTPVDTSKQNIGPLVSTITAISADNPPVVTNTGVNGLVAGDTVKLIRVNNGQQISGMDFTVGVNTLSNTTFSLDYMGAIVATTEGSWRKVDTDGIFYPKKRTITSISNAAQAVVKTSVTHGYSVGQTVRLRVSSPFGMVQINGLAAKIVAVNTENNTFTIDVDSTGFTPFVFPESSPLSFSFPEVIPFGESASVEGEGKFDDAVYNASVRGLELTGGVFGPGGEAGNEMYWTAVCCSAVRNEY